jgi:tripartite-type tricarboxylate transporter receptor subunit TctC
MAFWYVYLFVLAHLLPQAMNTLKRQFLIRTVCALSAASALPVLAQGSFPSKSVTITTAFAAGSGPDAVLRQVSDKLSKLWNQPVLVNNKPGGGGFIAMESVQRLPADGYNLLQLDSEHLAAVPHLYKSKNFVTLNTFDPVATLFRTPFFIAVATDAKWQNMKDLIADAKAARATWAGKRSNCSVTST